MASSTSSSSNQETAFLLHFADSILPVGSYAHSFGLEGMVQMGIVKDVDSLKLFLLRDVWHGLLHVDVPTAMAAHQLVTSGKLEQLKKLDETARALRPTKQLRLAASRIGKQTWELYSVTWQSETSCLDKSHFLSLQSSVISGAIYADQAIPVKTCLMSLSYQCYSTLLQASLKLLPIGIGPRKVQMILTEVMQSVASQLEHYQLPNEEQWGSYQPLWDIAASQHEKTSERLFIS